MQTAVEYIEQCFSGMYESAYIKKVLQEAKEMEKQQIIDAYADGRISVIDREIISYEQYYNETFKTK